MNRRQRADRLKRLRAERQARHDGTLVSPRDFLPMRGRAGGKFTYMERLYQQRLAAGKEVTLGLPRATVVGENAPEIIATLSLDTSGFSQAVVQAIAALGDAMRPAWLQDEPRHQDTAFIGWKRAGLTVHSGRAHFTGVGIKRTYGVDEDAAHAVTPLSTWLFPDVYPHEVPDPTGVCQSCGFYAFADRDNALLRDGTALLQVELSGTVIRHERGYRAGHQRVLGVWVERWCQLCDRATATGLHPTTHRHPFTDGTPLEPRCDLCSVFDAWPLADVANMLGCEVRWLDSEE